MLIPRVQWRDAHRVVACHLFLDLSQDIACLDREPAVGKGQILALAARCRPLVEGRFFPCPDV